ncbi:hypothetical protein BC832DRAFT_554400 [Gaertneriomyces semiglobifer]|nr:hypothetical protein BC832DRAFT_554400 [Gaertneriomyces semiglobifer]
MAATTATMTTMTTMTTTTTTTTTTTGTTPQTMAMYKKAAIQQDFERILQSGAPTTRITLSSRWDSNDDPGDLDDVDIYYNATATTNATTATPTAATAATGTPTSITSSQEVVSMDRMSVGTHITTTSNNSNNTAYSLQQPPTSPTASSKLVGFLKNNMGAPRKRFFGFGRSKSIVPSSSPAAASLSNSIPPTPTNPPILNNTDNTDNTDNNNNNTNTTDPLHVHFSDLQNMSFPDDASRNKAVRRSIIIAEDQGRLVLPRLQSLHSHQQQSSSPESFMTNTTQDPAPLLKMPDESFRVSLFDPKVLGLGSPLHSPNDDDSVGDEPESASVTVPSPPPPIAHLSMDRFGKNENAGSPPVDDVALPVSMPYYTRSPAIESPPHHYQTEVSPDSHMSPYDDAGAYTPTARQEEEYDNNNDDEDEDDYLLDMDDETLHNTELNTLVPVVPVSYNGLVIQPGPRIKLNRNRNRNVNGKIGVSNGGVVNGGGRGRVIRFDERTELCRGAWIDEEGEVWAYPETDVQWGTLNGETEESDGGGGVSAAMVGEGEFDRGWVRQRTSSLRRDDGLMNTIGVVNTSVGANASVGGNTSVSADVAGGETPQPQIPVPIVVGQVQRTDLVPAPVGRVHPVPPVSPSDSTTVTPPQPSLSSSSMVSGLKIKDSPQDLSHTKPPPQPAASDEKPPEKQRRKKIRHVQIQTRPMTSPIQNLSMISDSTKPILDDGVNADVTNVTNVANVTNVEIEQLKATVAAQQKKFDTLSKQAYQKVKQLLVERETLVGELEVVRGVVRGV